MKTSTKTRLKKAVLIVTGAVLALAGLYGIARITGVYTSSSCEDEPMFFFKGTAADCAELEQ